MFALLRAELYGFPLNINHISQYHILKTNECLLTQSQFNWARLCPSQTQIVTGLVENVLSPRGLQRLGLFVKWLRRRRGEYKVASPLTYGAEVSD